MEQMLCHVGELLATFWTGEGVAVRVLLLGGFVVLLFSVSYQFGEPGQCACGGPAAAERLLRSGVAPAARDSIHAPSPSFPAALNNNNNNNDVSIVLYHHYLSYYTQRQSHEPIVG